MSRSSHHIYNPESGVSVAYIAIGLVPFEWACRHSVDSLVIQAFPRLNQQKYVMARKVVEAFAVYGVSLGIALAIPGDSAKIIAVTGGCSNFRRQIHNVQLHSSYKKRISSL